MPRKYTWYRVEPRIGKVYYVTRMYGNNVVELYSTGTLYGSPRHASRGQANEAADAGRGHRRGRGL